MRDELAQLRDALVARSAAENGIDFDAFGDAVTAVFVTAAEIEELIVSFEERGGALRMPPVGGGMDRLRQVLVAARGLRQSLGRRPSIEELAKETGLAFGVVRAALSLGSVMGR
ncbi:MAG: hypothetical protein IPG50_12095 [Myxococcales bacterium]|nr:hypothetical protein [Myxococcales bacterium]